MNPQAETLLSVERKIPRMVMLFLIYWKQTVCFHP